MKRFPPHTVRKESSDTCEGCNARTVDGHPSIQAAIRAVQANFLDAHVSWVFRDEAEQKRVFTQKLSKTPWPKSRHNVMKDGKPCAEAVDFFRLLPAKIATFPYPFFKQIADYLKEKAHPVDWGHDLWGWDAGHFQLKSPGNNSKAHDG